MSYATKTESSALNDTSPPLPTFYKERRFRIAVTLLGIIYREAVFHCNDKTPDQQVLLGDLLNIRLAPLWRRWFSRNTCKFADLATWKQVEEKTLELMKLLGPDERRKVQIKFISTILLEAVALTLLVIATLALIAALHIGEQPGKQQNVLFILCFICWFAATGALGSTAFIYVNALSIQVDATADITSRTLVIMRLILGALFAVMLALPFGSQPFHNFSESLSPGKTINPTDNILLLLPFIMGFSTPLVLAVLGRLIQGARVLFGLPHDAFNANSHRSSKRAGLLQPKKRRAGASSGHAPPVTLVS
jgi:hypothetical protein